jgi:hypothetical protein
VAPIIFPLNPLLGPIHEFLKISSNNNKTNVRLVLIKKQILFLGIEVR